MFDQLPEYIDPLQLADKRGELHGEIPLNCLSRLNEMLASDEGNVSVDFFFRREGRLAVIEGQIRGLLRLKCQNCLDAINWPFESAIKLGIVNSIEQANKLPDDYEPLLIGEVKMPFKEIVEEELLLILPEYPKHVNCLPSQSNNNPVSAHNEAHAQKETPFSILAKLKN